MSLKPYVDVCEDLASSRDLINVVAEGGQPVVVQEILWP